jgi:hypothetical protein
MVADIVDLWSLFGLRESPFFQDTLTPGSRYPPELFVGRELETQRILRHVASSPSSRQVLHGPPGIGKTTLAQHVKHLLSREGFFVRWRPVAVTAGHGSAALLVDVLASVHESVLTGHPSLADEEALEAARGLVRSFRQTTISGGISVVGSGIEASRQTTYVRPVDAGIMQEAWRLLLEITALASVEHDAAGIIVHLNNLENLASAQDLEDASRGFRDLRDLFLAPGLHWLVVGTSEEALGILGAYPQVRSVFLPSHPPLAPLSGDDFIALLHSRYRHLRAKGHDVIPPVEDDSARTVYELFHGDLRGALRTLEQGCLALAGLTEGEPVRALNYDELTATLRPVYAAEMLADVSDRMVERMREIADIRGEGVTQAQLRETWDVTPQRVSQVVGQLERRGYLRQVGTRGRSKVYALTGTGLIALGLAVE